MKLFNKQKGQPTFLALAAIAVLSVVFSFELITTIAVVTVATVIGIWLNKGAWKGDIVYFIIAYLVIILAYSFPDFFNATV